MKKIDVKEKYLNDYINKNFDDSIPDEREVIKTLDFENYVLEREWKNLLEELSIMAPFKWFLRNKQKEGESHVHIHNAKGILGRTEPR
jgi:hypothetical protein